MTIVLRPYKAGSKSSKALSQALGIRRMAQTNSKFKGGLDDTLINWGCNELPEINRQTCIINQPDAVKAATNKLEFFEQMGDVVKIPAYFTTIEEAREYMEETGKAVVCRTLLRANSGRGIVIADTVEDLVEAPLYTEYVKKKLEYRIHVMFGEVIDIQQKARRMDIADEDVNWRVRNHDNGFIFKREGVEVSDLAQMLARHTVNRCNLHFGAVDLIYNEKEDQYYVLEVNTAPGLEGQTLENYRRGFTRHIRALRQPGVRPERPQFRGLEEDVEPQPAVAAPVNRRVFPDELVLG